MSQNLRAREAFLSALAQRAIANARVIATYAPKGSEIDPAPLEDHARRSGKALALPWFADREARMQFIAWDAGDALVMGPFGILQPGNGSLVLTPDMIVTPLLGFDRGLNRLGQGAGHYDRAFEAFPEARRIGLAWSCQEVSAIPVDPWDRALHAVLTEREWIGPDVTS